MPEDEHVRPANNGTRICWRRDIALREMGPQHSSADCHEIVLRLKTQAQCLEAVLEDIRREIDLFESEEIIESIKEEQFEANT